MERVCARERPTNINTTETWMEAMIFARNVHKIMQEHVNITVTCSSDGSSMNGAGNYVV